MALTAPYSGLVLKGTRHGLLASIREDSDWSVILSELNTLSSNGEGFLTDASLTFDFGWREITETQFDQVIGSLSKQGLACNGILSTSLNTRTIAEAKGYRAIIGRLGLAKHHGRKLRREQDEATTIQVAEVPTPTIRVQAQAPVTTSTVQAPPVSEPYVRPVEIPEQSIELDVIDSQEIPASPSQEGVHVPHYEDEEPTLYLRKTLRSGQRVVFAGNVVLLGDLNPGAQIEADGDIIVMGQLRGSVHAGAEGDTEASVITSSLRATQLRIADRFWSGEQKSSIFKKQTVTGTLKATLNGDSVVVEALPVR